MRDDGSKSGTQESKLMAVTNSAATMQTYGQARLFPGSSVDN